MVIGSKSTNKFVHASCGKKAQVTIFIILAIILVAGVITYFVLSGSLTSKVSKNFEPAYNKYLSCVEERARSGIALMGQQGGYIYSDELAFEPGSEYSPVSSQLSLNGQPVPYWFYVSGNNIMREQIPTKEKMQSELSRYISEGLNDCDLSDFNAQGIYVDIYNGSVDAQIKDGSVDLTINNPVYFYFENDSASVSEHSISVKSKLGKFYNMANQIYNAERKDTFLESYGLDTMRLYAPVDGIEVQCSPMVFDDTDIRNNITYALETNIAHIKVKGNYYGSTNPYYIVDAGFSSDENVNFLYSSSWPTKIDIAGDRVAEPIGMQSGMGILGFCYVPYHFVYNIYFPVLMQIYDADEMFQFPVQVIIQNNQAKNATLVSNGASLESEVCKYKNQDVKISTYDLNLNPVKANLRFSCLNDGCAVGQTSLKNNEAVLDAKLPQCVNGVLSAYAEGYAPANVVLSTNVESSADVLMYKLYNLSLDLGRVEKALVLFNSKDYSASAYYPDMKDIQLIEGEYNISVYAYKNSSIVIPAINNQECVDVTSSGIAGMLGQKEQKCFDINIPAQNVESALIGGGNTVDYFTESQLSSAKEMNINVPLFGSPKSITDLQNSYAKLGDSILDISFD